MAVWGFRCYVDGRGVDEVRAWYDNCDEDVQDKFYQRLFVLRTLELHDWKGEPFKRLHGKHKGLGEIRFQVRNVVYRPLGFHHGRNFVILNPDVIEKGGDFKPRNAPNVAMDRKTEVLRTPEKTCDLNWLPFQ